MTVQSRCPLVQIRVYRQLFTWYTQSKMEVAMRKSIGLVFIAIVLCLSECAKSRSFVRWKPKPVSLTDIGDSLIENWGSPYERDPYKPLDLK